MNKLICLFVCLSLSGCQYFAIEEKIFGKYYLVAADEGDQCALSYHENDRDNYSHIVGATVFAVGFNENYMIIKQHPRTWPYPHENVTYFYILPLKEGMDWCTMNGLLGPMTIEQFNQKRKDLNIPNSLTFTKVMKDLE